MGTLLENGIEVRTHYSGGNDLHDDNMIVGGK